MTESLTGKPTEPAGLNDFFRLCRDQVNSALAELLQAPCSDHRLGDALRYAVLGEGKRLRPILVFAACEAAGGSADKALPAACAVELLHTYSLVHDDLPAMDDDDLRRGKPSLHRAYDEALAILAGDALQSLAFQALCDTRSSIEANTQTTMVSLLAQAAGPAGMVAGQAIDIAASGQVMGLEDLETMHRLKTGALIKASVQLGALSGASLSKARLDALSEFADCIGLAFQVRDDILDVEGDTAALGKPQGSDDRANKPTFASLLGLDAAKLHAGRLVERARASLTEFGPEADRLRGVADYIVDRPH